jgi:hypothetical protein
MTTKYLAIILIIVLIISVRMFLYYNNSKPTNPVHLIGKLFPPILAKTLSGQKINFPDDVMGKFSVLVLAFEGKTQSQADSWTSAVSQKYPQNEINYYEIPMISGNYGLVSGFIDGGMRAGVDQKLHKSVATYYGELEWYKTFLNIVVTDQVYVFLLDKDGKIVATQKGLCDPKKAYNLFENISV